MGLKKVLNRPFWMANLHFYGLEYGKGKKGLFMGPGFFRGKAGAAPKVLDATGNLRRVNDTVRLFGFSC